jgi:hypothetical protein
MVPAEMELLKGLSLFAGIPEKAREKVIEKVRKYIHLCTYSRGEVILREGDYGDSAYYIVAGTVEVVLGRPGEPDRPPPPRVRGGAHRVRPGDRAGARPGAERMIGRGGIETVVVLSAVPAEVAPGGRAVLEAGEIFGEISALSRYPISATVRAASPLKLDPPARPAYAGELEGFKKFLDTRYRERTSPATSGASACSTTWRRR